VKPFRWPSPKVEQPSEATAAEVLARPPAGELTWQAVVGAVLVASLVAFSYPYIVLKLGLGPDVSLLSAFLGAVFLHVAAAKTRGRNRLMNNIVQTAGTSASQTAFMCVVAAAFGYLGQNQAVDVDAQLTPWKIFTWLVFSGTIGVLFIPLFRRYFLDDPRLVFPDGVAAAETIIVMDAEDAGTRRKIWALSGGAAAGALFSYLSDGLNRVPAFFFSQRFAIGWDWSLLSMGMGLLVGTRVGLSMLIGVAFVGLAGPQIIGRAGFDIVATGIAPQNVAQCQALYESATRTAEQTGFVASSCGQLSSLIAGDDFSIVLLWVMWPATALLVSSALTTVLLRWRSIVTMFRQLAAARPTPTFGGDISLRTTLIGVGLCTIALAYIQNVHFGLSYVQTFVAVLFELPLMLIGVRVLGETNFGPVSVTANTMQAVYAVLFPGKIVQNLVAAGMTGDGNSQAEGTMQDFRAGERVGSTPRVLTYTQMLAIPIGAAAVAIMYPLLVAKYGLGPQGLVAPTGLKFANMAVVLSRGLIALPPGAIAAIAAATVVGVLMAVLEDRKAPFLPSAAAIAFALILPGTLSIVIAFGAAAGWLWNRLDPQRYTGYHFALAAGLISGDAVISGLILPALAALNVRLPGA
jgi:uncharacterized oligopeptide transporter (OPT) family protein